MPPDRGSVIVQVMKPKEIIAMAMPAMTQPQIRSPVRVEGRAVIEHRAHAQADAHDADIVDEGIRQARGPDQPGRLTQEYSLVCPNIGNGHYALLLSIYRLPNDAPLTLSQTHLGDLVMPKRDHGALQDAFGVDASRIDADGLADIDLGAALVDVPVQARAAADAP